MGGSQFKVKHSYTTLCVSGVCKLMPRLPTFLRIGSDSDVLAAAANPPGVMQVAMMAHHHNTYLLSVCCTP